MRKKRLRAPFYILLILITALVGYLNLKTKPQESFEIGKIEDSILIDVSDTTISMSVIGDIMCHNSQYKDAYNSKTGKYDFSYVFEDIKQYKDDDSFSDEKILEYEALENKDIDYLEQIVDSMEDLESEGKIKEGLELFEKFKSLVKTRSRMI